VWDTADKHHLRSTNGQQMKKRRFRLFAAACGLGLTLLAVGACGDDEPDLDYTAVAGESCQDCHECSDIVGSCVCETCTSYAYDPERKQLLVCTGLWKVEKECPGGVSVVCASTGGYKISCLDDKGQPK
jgi:hypothetical protein